MAINASEERESPPMVEEKWAKSKSKAILHAGLLNGTLTENTKPKEAFLADPAYTAYIEGKGKTAYTK